MLTVRTIIKTLLVSLTLLASCKSAQVPVQQVPIQYKERVVERLVPIQIPADSASVQALFECDSLNRVIMLELNESKSKGVQSGASFRNGNFKYIFKTVHDTIYIPAKDSIIYQEIAVEVPVPYEVNKLTWEQRISIRAGHLFFVMLIVGMAYMVAKGKLKLITKPFWFIWQYLKK